MGLELAGIAAAVVGTFLKPLLTGATETLTDKVGESAAGALTGIAGKIWNRVQRAFGSERERDALQNFEKDPDVYAPTVEVLLERKLQEDPELLSELQALLQEPVPGTNGDAWHVMGENIEIVSMHKPTFSGGKQIIGNRVYTSDHGSDESGG